MSIQKTLLIGAGATAAACAVGAAMHFMTAGEPDAPPQSAAGNAALRCAEQIMPSPSPKIDSPVLASEDPYYDRKLAEMKDCMNKQRTLQP